MNAKFEIVSTDGVTSKVLLNGIDISNNVSRVEFSHEGGKLSELCLHFKADCVSISSLGNVKFPNAVFKILTKKQKEELLMDIDPDETATNFNINGVSRFNISGSNLNNSIAGNNILDNTIKK